MTADLPALLEELKEADFETWKDVRFHLINIFSVNDLGDINLRSPLLQNAYSDTIQGCIQRACETNKWYLQQTSEKEIHPSDGAKYRAQIKVKRDEYTDKNFWGKSADTPAAAILAAYLAARKAMR